MVEARQAWHDIQGRIDPRRFVFIDECGVVTNMARRTGRAPRGERLVASIPHGHWKNLTFTAALRCDGITAPMVHDGAMNGRTFRTYVRELLIPTLQPGDIVVADNLKAHKAPGVQKMIEEAGAEIWYLPPYSPDLNPIEHAFAKLKALLRKAAVRSIDDLWRTIGYLLDSFTERECWNLFQYASYA